MSVRAAASILLAAAAWAAGDFPGLAGQSSALWRIVHGACVADQIARDDPAPCAKVDLKAHYAILKDIRGKTQYLLIPTERVTGVESPALLRKSSPNYFAYAWRERGFVERSLGRRLSRDGIGLAINSIYGRSQNQLHIHIDCLRADVRRRLAAVRDRVLKKWTRLPIRLAGRSYRARRVDGADLHVDPFKLLAGADPSARADMGRRTLVVVGESFARAPGFLILVHRANLATGDRGSGEDLLDHACALAR